MVSRMLTRLYVDNFKSLVNFEVALDRTNLLLGANGAGKTTVFEVINLLGNLMRGGAVDVSERTLTRWQSRTTQTFRVDMTVDERRYRYTLELEHDVDRGRCSISSEELVIGIDQLLFRAQAGKAQLYRDDKTTGPEVLADRRRSSLPVIQGRSDNKLLTEFVKSWQRVLVIQNNPMGMANESEEEDEVLRKDLANFPSWWRHIHSTNVRASGALQRSLAEVIRGFEGLEFQNTGGKVRRLQAVFKSVKYDFKELSDGQRTLIALYALLASATDQDFTCCLDEPDNFVALREIQPLLYLFDEKENIQTILISHHPEILNMRAVECGIVFRRGAEGPARTEPFSADPSETLTVAELVARGYLDDAQ